MIVLKYDPVGDKSKNEGVKMLPEDLYLKWNVKEQGEAKIDTKATVAQKLTLCSVQRPKKLVIHSDKHSHPSS